MRSSLCAAALLVAPGLAQDLRAPIELETGPIIRDAPGEGFWVSSHSSVKTFAALAGREPDGFWTQTAIDLSRAPQTAGALVFEGILVAPRDGSYGFRVSGSSEARFLLGDELLGREGEIGLQVGPHRFRVEVLHPATSATLDVAWSGPGFDEHELVHEDLHPGRNLRAAGGAAPRLDERVSTRKIWSGGHCAFTDLARLGGKLYCCFREGERHVHGADGKIRVIVSADGGLTWTSVALLAQDGVDLRDPKLSLTPDGRLMLTLGGSRYEGGELRGRTPMVSFSDAACEGFEAPRAIRVDEAIQSNDDWLWRVTWHEGVGYGFVYQARAESWGLHLVRTRDGLDYELVRSFEIDGRPNEATIRFDERGRMAAFLRREEGNRHAWLGKSWAPFENWVWGSVGRRVGGPNFVVLADGRWIGSGREYSEDGARTALGPLLLSFGAGEYRPSLELPSGGDTSYAGMLVDGERLLVSYYSSHAGPASIYLAEVPLEVFGRSATGK